MKQKLKGSILLLSAMLLFFHAHGQTQPSQTALFTKLTTLRDDYINKIKAMGYTPRLPAPTIVLDNPPSFGNYDDTTNILHTCDWNTIPEEVHAIFFDIAKTMGGNLTGEKFFDTSVHKWIFIHEMSHWWRACQHIKTDHYEEEKGADRIAAAYWNENDPAFYQLMLKFFGGIVEHTPNPVPQGKTKEKYLDENYPNFPDNVYAWYQSIMIVEVSKERPFETFKQAITLSGLPLSR